MRRVKQLFHTIKYLRYIQIVYQIKYRFIKPKPLNRYLKANHQTCALGFIENPPVYNTWDGRSKFNFLNQTVEFENEINWNFQENGKLWNYNLQYANYLLQENISDEAKYKVISSLYVWLNEGRLMLEPYPVSLRVINMIRWLGDKEPQEYQVLKGNVYAELDFLSNRLEYHLLGNHLLENAFALMMGGCYFKNESWVKKASALLEVELKEQILEDGAHFELSPMYHQIIFFRLLELIDWYSTWNEKEIDFEYFLRNNAADMRSWLQNISFQNGDIPHFNDSTSCIAYSTKWVCDYADKLAILSSNKSLSISGYRGINQDNYECRMDFAKIGPNHQPGHAHADILSFILYYKGNPLFVEQGTSTYQIGKRRQLERSTIAHNTVCIDGLNQSDVWGGFRVATRAYPTILQDEDISFSAQHDGYKSIGATHRRSIQFEKNAIHILDNITSSNDHANTFHLHLYESITATINQDKVELSNGVNIAFTGYTDISLEQYKLATGYNKYINAIKLVVSFPKLLNTTIYFID